MEKVTHADGELQACKAGESLRRTPTSRKLTYLTGLVFLAFLMVMAGKKSLYLSKKSSYQSYSNSNSSKHETMLKH